MSWYLKVLKQYARFHGRSRRKEYWYFSLFNFLIGFIIALFLPEELATMISFIYSCAILPPGFGVTIRRLHDTNRSGWWILITLIPLIGAFILLYFMIQDSQAGRNRFGRNPKE